MSSEDHHNTEVSRGEAYLEDGHSFDELAKGLAEQSITRGRALKLVGTTLLGAVGLGGLPSAAEAKKKKKKKKKHHRSSSPLPPPPCGPDTCLGCCDANGTCQPGNTDAACSSGGAPCQVCTDNQHVCLGGLCVNCGNIGDPCCANGTCQLGVCQGGICLFLR